MYRIFLQSQARGGCWAAFTPLVELQNEHQSPGKFEGIPPAVHFFFFFSLSGYLETAALITANNLDLIFSLSKNVMAYQ